MMRSNSTSAPINPLTAMRKTTSLALLLLGGCASAAGPQPAAVESAPVPVNIRPLQATADETQPKRQIVTIQTGACETNDRMAVGSFRVEPRPQTGLPRGMSLYLGSAPMPNACPVTVPPASGVIHYAAGGGAKGTAQLKAKVGGRR
jgi:hypothetical protein